MYSKLVNKYMFIMQNGKTSLDIARHFGHNEIVSYLEKILEAQRRVSCTSKSIGYTILINADL